MCSISLDISRFIYRQYLGEKITMNEQKLKPKLNSDYYIERLQSVGAADHS